MKPESRKMRVAMVGVGGFGAYRRGTLRQSGLYEVVAVYDHNPENLARGAREERARPVRSYPELLATPDIEAIFIATGAKFHAAQALAALRRGLHVFVEKPLCATPREMRALLALQRQTGLVVGVGHNDHRHDAAAVSVKRLIDRGALGAIASFEITTAHGGGLAIRPGEWRGDPRRNPGGMLFQCGCHALHELMFYFGPVRSVSALMRYNVHTTRTADTAHCLLELANGVSGTLSAYHVTPYRHTFNIYGTRRNLYKDERFFDEGTTVLLQAQGYGKQEPQAPLPIEGRSDPAGSVKSFYRAVRCGGEPYPSLKDGARAVAVIFAAEQAARTGRKIRVLAVD
jgi:predicted dehydrogenase